jgi:hypothetical protein
MSILQDEVKDSFYYELMLWRIRDCYAQTSITRDFLIGEPGTDVPLKEIEDALAAIDGALLSMQMAYERWTNFLVSEGKVTVEPEPLPGLEPELLQEAAVTEPVKV